MIKMWKNKRKSNVGEIMVGALLLIICCMTFLWIELNRNGNQENTLYTNTQQILLEKCEEELKVQLATADCQTKELVAIVEKYFPFQGSTWGYFCVNDAVVYVKDEDATVLYEGQSEKQLRSAMTETNSVSLDFSMGENTYIVGMMYTTSYMSELTKDYIHRMYLIIDFGILSVVLYIIVVYQAGKRRKQEATIHLLEEQMREQNLQLEAFSEEIVAQRPAELKNKNMIQSDYNRGLLEKLLEKSVDEKLYPFGMYVIKIQMQNRYFSKKEMQELTAPIRSHVDEKQRLLETAKGEFVLLLYQTTTESYERAGDFLENEWAKHRKDVEVAIGSAYHETVSVQLVEEYKNIRKGLIEL